MVLVAATLAGERPDEVALRDDDVALGWAEVNDILNRVVNGLGELDLGPDRRVAVLAENSVETVLAHLGGLLAGASTVPVNFHLNADEVAYILEDSGAQVLFVGPGTAATGLDAARRAGVPVVIGWRVADEPDVRSWEDWLAAASPAEPSPRRRAATQPDVHVGHDRPAQGRRAAADDVRRRRHDDRARGRARPERLRRLRHPPRRRPDVPHRSAVGRAPAGRRRAGRRPRALRRRERAAGDRDPPGRDDGDGADPLRPPAGAARRGAGRGTTSARCGSSPTPAPRARSTSSTG